MLDKAMPMNAKLADIQVLNIIGGAQVVRAGVRVYRIASVRGLNIDRLSKKL